MKKVQISVTDFALPAPRKGSIDLYSGFARAQEAGSELHRLVQNQRKKTAPETYSSEVCITQTFQRGGFEFEISGRIDGLFERENPKVEEIKTSFNLKELLRKLKEAKDDHPYRLQARTYAYFYWLQNQKVPEISLYLVSTRNFESKDFSLELDIGNFESWLERRLDELVLEAIAAEKRVQRRKKAAAALEFPFQQPRSGQIELIESIEMGMKEKRPMLIQAPTGLGKTLGVLYPSLREALNRGQRVIYTTPKNSQHGVAEDAVTRLQDKGAKIKSMTLTAKSKICFKNEPVCNPDYCEYAKDHYTKIAEHKILDLLAKKRSLKARTFKKIASEFEVCPFELQLDGAQEADTIICDYNYVFAPRSALGRMSGLSIDQQGKPNLVIDEAHNLPSRSMDYYSPSLSSAVLEKMRDEMKLLPKRFRSDALGLLEASISVVRACGPADALRPLRIDPPVEKFLAQDAELRNFLATYLSSDIEIQAKDVVLRLAFYWSDFSSALEFVTAGRKEFFTSFHPHPATVKITCCDASEMLKDSFENYDQVVGFSATLKPFEYYQELSGLKNKVLKTAEFKSPFSVSKRKLLIIPQISSKYSDRERSYPRISETIQKIVSLRSGNYFVFFPSFDFMERLLQIFIPPLGFEILHQTRYMKRDAVEDILEKLKVPHFHHLVFAVQGGIFSEGIDYPGDMAIGAFVIGPPLPNFDLEREGMRAYYEENYEAGFDYAYTYPAMAKAVQAAGRVIRSETDKGIIILMDNRFIQSSYAKSMPQDWFKESPSELVSQKILSEISEFWDKNP